MYKFPIGDLVIFVKVVNGVSKDIFIILEFLDIIFLFQLILGQIKIKIIYKGYSGNYSEMNKQR